MHSGTFIYMTKLYQSTVNYYTRIFMEVIDTKTGPLSITYS